ncbi:hypothetical protein [Hydrocarboniclastica marina]|uniref:Uncharacterized protein n=1 Tax=Hydrocarboniclastica marina TaxID=2259620 RepID=A0A4P7XIU2_9ALTE|nr:hypothetical protein [Hydrocarboniclastica marina]QCF26454.1 hypothetical protein soil367_11185 [Hydrocarboniclastica marina]
MDQWQSCLAPVCQIALTRAHQTVSHRGGDTVTPEDFLLAVLDVDEDLVPFLGRWGVDIDELVRTVQSEQPFTAPATVEPGLSNALVDWFASARERYDDPWLSTHQLFSALVYSAERFQDKAYVAVLEQVPRLAWADSVAVLPGRPGPSGMATPPASERSWLQSLNKASVSGFPLSASTHELAMHLVTRLMEPAGGLIWLQTSSSSRVEGLLGQVRRMAQAVHDTESRAGAAIRRAWFKVDWEGAGESDGALDALFESLRSCCQKPGPTVFLFQECSPTVLMLFIQRLGVLKWRHLFAVARPLIVLTSPPLKHVQSPSAWLEDSLGQELRTYAVPMLPVEECLRYLRFCQPGMERRWQLEIADAALRTAAYLARSTQDPACVSGESDPETAVSLLEDAMSTKVTLQANGSSRLAELRSRQEDLQRRSITAEARNERVQDVQEAFESVCLELAAEEVFWHEHAAPISNVLMAEDVVRQALRQADVPLTGPGERIRETLPDLNALAPVVSLSEHRDIATPV